MESLTPAAIPQTRRVFDVEVRLFLRDGSANRSMIVRVFEPELRSRGDDLELVRERQRPQVARVGRRLVYVGVVGVEIHHRQHGVAAGGDLLGLDLLGADLKAAQVDPSRPHLPESLGLFPLEGS